MFSYTKEEKQMLTSEASRMNIQNRIEKLEEKRKNVLNPDDFSWDDIGFDEKPEEWDTVEDFLEHGDFNGLDEETQVIIRCIDEELDELRERVEFTSDSEPVEKFLWVYKYVDGKYYRYNGEARSYAVKHKTSDITVAQFYGEPRSEAPWSPEEAGEWVKVKISYQEGIK